MMILDPKQVLVFRLRKCAETRINSEVFRLFRMK